MVGKVDWAVKEIVVQIHYFASARICNRLYGGKDFPADYGIGYSYGVGRKGRRWEEKDDTWL